MLLGCDHLHPTLGEEDICTAGARPENGRAAASVGTAGQPGHPGACGGSCPALGTLGHLDLQVLVLIQVTGAVPGLLSTEASTSDLPEEGGALLLPAEPAGDRRVGSSQWITGAANSSALL